jgi:hypothetical protein
VKYLLILASLGAVMGIVGCGADAPKVDDGYMKSAADIGEKVKAMRDRTGGDYSKLTPEEKKTYVDSFNGDETRAIEFWDKMKTGDLGSSQPKR